eukprot:10764307-Alexandrium_andersonii.AAC.1
MRIPPRRCKYTGWQPHDDRARSLYSRKFCDSLVGAETSLHAVSLADIHDTSISNLEHAITDSALSIPFNTHAQMRAKATSVPDEIRQAEAAVRSAPAQ